MKPDAGRSLHGEIPAPPLLKPENEHLDRSCVVPAQAVVHPAVSQALPQLINEYGLCVLMNGSGSDGPRAVWARRKVRVVQPVGIDADDLGLGRDKARKTEDEKND